MYNPKPVIGQISGFINFNESQQYLYSHWLDLIKQSYELYGFTPFTPRPVELRDNLHAKGGIGKEIYAMARLADPFAVAADGRPEVVATDIGLPFDRTVPLALWVAQHLGELVLPYKRYDIGWVFRGERPQAGRYRGFHQADVDIIGRNLGLTADVECLLAIAHALTALNVGPFSMHINHIVLAKQMIRARGVVDNLEAEVLRILDKLEKLQHSTVRAELAKTATAITEEHLDQLMELFTYRGDCAGLRAILTAQADVPEIVWEACKQLEELSKLLSIAGCSAKIVINPGIVRGLDYYTGIVVETFLVGKETSGSIASGGRYSRLVSDFSGKGEDVEGVGLSIGVTRLFDIMSRSGGLSLERKSAARVVVAYCPENLTMAFALCTGLRNAGITVDMYANPARPIKNQLEYAHKKGAPYVLILMNNNEKPEHIDNFILRDMQTRDQHEWPELAAAIDGACAVLKKT